MFLFDHPDQLYRPVPSSETVQPTGPAVYLVAGRAEAQEAQEGSPFQRQVERRRRKGRKGRACRRWRVGVHAQGRKGCQDHARGLRLYDIVDLYPVSAWVLYDRVGARR